jgi:hypothetical protein
VTGAAAVVALTAAVRSRPKKKKKRIWG